MASARVSSNNGFAARLVLHFALIAAAFAIAPAHVHAEGEGINAQAVTAPVAAPLPALAVEPRPAR
jgi:hypothetical protein